MLMFAAICAAAAIAVPVEMILYVAAPERLAKLAWQRFGDDRVRKLGAPALDALAPAGGPALGYRQGAGRRPDLRNLAVAAALRGEGYVAALVPERGFAVVRARSTSPGSKQIWALARIDLSLQGDELRATARYTMMPLSPFLAFFSGAAVLMVSELVAKVRSGGLTSEVLAKAAVGPAVLAIIAPIVALALMGLASARLEQGINDVIDAVFDAAEGAGRAPPNALV